MINKRVVGRIEGEPDRKQNGRRGIEISYLVCCSDICGPEGWDEKRETSMTNRDSQRRLR